MTGLSAVTYGASAGFVAVGANGIAWRSQDGFTWSTESVGNGNSLYALTCGDGQYVAADADGTILVSEDAVNWTRHPIDIHPTFKSAAFSGSAFVSVGDAGAIVTSTP